MAFLPPCPWNFICYWGKHGNFFLPLQRPACSAPSAPMYTSASLHLGPVWSPVAPVRWGKKVPSTLNPVVGVSHSSSLIWYPSCSRSCWQPEEMPSPARFHCRTGPVRAVFSLWWEGRRTSLSHQLCKNMPNLSDFSGYLWVLARLVLVKQQLVCETSSQQFISKPKCFSVDGTSVVGKRKNNLNKWVWVARSILSKLWTVKNSGIRLFLFSCQT